MSLGFCHDCGENVGHASWCERLKKSELDQLRQRVAELELALENEQAKGIHSCHADCSLDGCVNRRLRESLSASQLREKQLRDVMPETIWALRQLGGNEYARRLEALALPQDDSALREYLAGKMKPLVDGYEAIFQIAFSIYNTPRDRFNTDEQWALFCYRKIYDNLTLFQNYREALEAARKELL